MSNTGVVNNVWFKLAIVSLVAIVLIIALLWGVNTFIYGNQAYGNMNMGYGYQMNGMNYQGQMNMQGSMSGSMNGGMQGGMGMMGGNMQGGMGMH